MSNSEIKSAILTIDEKGIIQSVDRSCCHLFGFELPELVGQSVNKLIPQCYREQNDSYQQAYQTTGKAKVIEAAHKSGYIFSIRVTINQVEASGGGKSFIATIDKLEDTSAIVICSMTGVISTLNQNCEDLFGYPVAEAVGKHISLLVPQGTQIDDPNSYGQIKTIAAKQQSGVVFPVRFQVKYIRVGDLEHLRCTVDVVDVEVVFALDQNGMIEVMDKTIAPTLFGYSDQELIGRNITSLMPTLYSIINEPSNLKTLRNDKQWKVKGTRRVDVRHKDGHTFLMDLSIKKYLSEDKAKFTAKIRSAVDSLALGDDSSEDEEEGEDTNQQVNKTDNMATANNTTNFNEQMIGDYYVGESLGKGAFGQVKVGIHKVTKQKVAIKILQKDLMEPAQITRTNLEIDILRHLSHINIVKLHDVVETPDRINIIMEYVGGGELQTYIQKREKLSEAEARVFFNQIVDAVGYCHGRKIVHRDLKHKNILLDDKYTIKIIDFGLSNFMVEDGPLNTFCGTPAYASPEMILAKKYLGPEVDIWSLGVVLFSMVCGRFPFRNVHDIIDGRYEAPSDLSPECVALVKIMLTVSTDHRATLADIRDHPWTKKAQPPLPQHQIPLQTSSPQNLSPTVTTQIHQAQSQQTQPQTASQPASLPTTQAAVIPAPTEPSQIPNNVATQQPANHANNHNHTNNNHNNVLNHANNNEAQTPNSKKRPFDDVTPTVGEESVTQPTKMEKT